LGETERVDVVHAPVLAGLAHGFLGRRGGVSRGVVAGLNVGLGAGDEAEAVAENRRRATEAVLPGADLLTLFQVHSADVVTVSEPWPVEERPRADAMVTDRPGLLLGILTADCAPVLLADRDAGVIGAAHAGWRGARGGVLENSVAAMERLGASAGRIAAAIGPCIAQASYEVDERFRQQFGPVDETFFAQGAPGRWQFDLGAYVAHRLRGCGLGEVEALALDTYSAPDRFFSYRRATHRGEVGYGRQISLIGLT
jgi:YfiH family protein